MQVTNVGTPPSAQWSWSGCIRKVLGDPSEAESLKQFAKDFWKFAIYDCVNGGLQLGMPGVIVHP